LQGSGAAGVSVGDECGRAEELNAHHRLRHFVKLKSQLVKCPQVRFEWSLAFRLVK